MAVAIGPDKINLAIRECLDRCYASPTPAVALADYLKQLSRSDGWQASEVNEVRTRAIRIFRNVAVPEED
jgi:hypothetical protein